MKPLALALAIAALSGTAAADTPAVCNAPAPAEPRAAAERIALCDLAPPIAATVWHCGGSPLETLTAVFFDTDPGTVRLEYAGTVEVGVQTVAASGARYETTSGLVFWTKGTEATVNRPGEPDGECIVR